MLLATAPLSGIARQVAFHPADTGKLVTVSGNTAGSGIKAGSSKGQEAPAVELWSLEQLWTNYHLSSQGVTLDGSRKAVCHAWAPEVGGMPISELLLTSAVVHTLECRFRGQQLDLLWI